MRDVQECTPKHISFFRERKGIGKDSVTYHNSDLMREGMASMQWRRVVTDIDWIRTIMVQCCW
jgi:hypothetical protein